MSGRMRRRGVRRGREGALDVSPHEPRSLVSTKSAIKIPYMLAAISTMWECTV